MVNVIGLGYIGLPTALMMASHGVEVVGTDYDEGLVATLNAGRTTFKEEGLDELFAAAVAAGVRFTTEYQAADTYVVSVPTPLRQGRQEDRPELRGRRLQDGAGGAPRRARSSSWSPPSPPTPSTASCAPLLEEAGRADVSLAHAPERIIPGNMVYELVHNNRTVGADDPAVGERVAELYSSFCEGEISVTDIRTAEMTKVVENTFRAVNIAFATSSPRSAASAAWTSTRSSASRTSTPASTSSSPARAWAATASRWTRGSSWATIRDGQLRPPRPADQRIHAGVRPAQGARGPWRSAASRTPARVGVYGPHLQGGRRRRPRVADAAAPRGAGQHLSGGAMRVYDPWVGADVVPNQVHSMDEFLDGLEMVIVMVGHSQVKGRPRALGDRAIVDPPQRHGRRRERVQAVGQQDEAFNAINKYRRANWLCVMGSNSWRVVRDAYLPGPQLICPASCEIGDGTTFGTRASE